MLGTAGSALWLAIRYYLIDGYVCMYAYVYSLSFKSKLQVYNGQNVLFVTLDE